MGMTFLIYFVLIALCLISVIGSIVPALPGPPLAWSAMVFAYFACEPYVSLSAVVIFGVLTLLAAILDYVAPGFVTKLGGGSRMAVIGSTVGVFAGLTFMPLGLVLGPLVGAFVGELMATNQTNVAFRVAILQFVSFLITTGVKLVLSLVMSYYVLLALIRPFISA